MKAIERIRKILPESGLNPDIFPLLPIVELAGCNRVLIENHLGVTQYSASRIGIKMKYGQLTVCGSKLMLEHMTQVRLLVIGQIDSLSLERRCRA